MAQTKEQWLADLSKESFSFFRYTKEINGKNQSVTYFTMYAEPEFKNDKDLNVLNFNHTGNCAEIPDGMIDFDFIKKVFNKSQKTSVLNLPYEWKHTQEEKDFLFQIIIRLKNKNPELRINDSLWTFEPNFWSNMEFTKEISEFDFDYFNSATIKELSKSKNKIHVDFTLELVDKHPYYLKYLSAKNKDLLSKETVIVYAKNYGLKSLTKKQTNDFEVVKEAFQSKQLSYIKLDDKWKNESNLIVLLDNKEIWFSWVNEKKHITLENIDVGFFENREVVKSILSNGNNLLEFKDLGYKNIFEDVEFKKIALKTCIDHEIISDRLDDKDIVLFYFQALNNKSIDVINLHEKTKRINPELFMDKEVMLSYLSIGSLTHKSGIVKAASDAIDYYDIDDCLDFISANKDAYSIMSFEKQNNIELAALFCEKNGWTSLYMNIDMRTRIDEMGFTFEEQLAVLKKLALNEKLNRKLSETNTTPQKKLKV